MFHLLRLRDVIELEAAYLPRPDKVTLSTPLTSFVASSKAAVSSTSSTVDANKYRPTIKDLLWHRATEKYVNKIIANQGLCVAVDEIEDCSSSCVRGNEGSAWSTVDFTVVIFRPSPGQRVAATIVGQDELGITLSLSFFAVFVPSHQLLAKSFFDKTKRSWFVIVDDDDDEPAEVNGSGGNGPSVAAKAKAEASPEAARNYYLTGADVLVTIDNVFVRTLSDTGASEKVAPMEVVGSFSSADGLGPRAWYD